MNQDLNSAKPNGNCTLTNREFLNVATLQFSDPSGTREW